MIKKTISYEDYDGNQRTEDFYFNLSKGEITEMQITTPGGLAGYLRKIIAEQDSKKIVEIWKDLIFKSYGEKSLDGKRFIKSEELSIAFSQTEAYSDLFVELSTDADAAADFVNGIVPKAVSSNPEVQAAVDKAMESIK